MTDKPQEAEPPETLDEEWYRLNKLLEAKGYDAQTRAGHGLSFWMGARRAIRGAIKSPMALILMAQEVHAFEQAYEKLKEGNEARRGNEATH